MQMNGFSLKQMGYFSCFRTMFVRHDLRNFIPRERGGGGGGVGLGIQGSFIRGGSGLRSNPSPFYILFLSEKAPFSCTF